MDEGAIIKMDKVAVTELDEGAIIKMDEVAVTERDEGAIIKMDEETVTELDEGAIVDDIFTSLNWRGSYQVLRCGVLLLSTITLAIHAESVVFTGKTVTHQCQPPQSLNVTVSNVTYDVMSASGGTYFNVSFGECSIDVTNGTDTIFSQSCHANYIYTGETKSTFVTQWDLVCESESLSDATQSVYAGGQMFGSLFFAPLSDRYGRKKVFVLTGVLQLLSSVVSSFPPNFIVYMFLRFLCGAFMATSFQMAYTLNVEMMPTKHRALVEQTSAFVWSFSLLLLCLISYLTRDLSWSYTQLILSLIGSYTVFIWWIVDESLRWLLEMKRYKEAEFLIKKMARINQVDSQKALNLLKKDKIVLEDVNISNGSQSLNKESSVAMNGSSNDTSLRMFLSNRNFLKLTCLSSFIWFVDAIAYDGLLMIAPGLTDNFYLGFALGVITDIPATVIFCLLINRIDRKKIISIFHLLAGICLLIATIILNTPLADKIPGNYWFSLVLSLLGRVTLSVGYSTVTLYVSEVFPTSVRSTGYGMTSIFNYSGSLVAPYSRTVSRHVPYVPNVVFGVMCVMVPAATVLLPETRGVELAQTLAETDKRMAKETTANKGNYR
nr:solute carrier family 22 member 6-like [Biomphalaria glabrata]